MIPYAGLSEAEVLQALYAGTRAVGMGALHDRPDGLPIEDAQEAWDILSKPEHRRPLGFHIDYLAGRPLKVYLNPENKVIGHEQLYDRDAGEGACQYAIDQALARKECPRPAAQGGGGDA